MQAQKLVLIRAVPSVALWWGDDTIGSSVEKIIAALLGSVTNDSW